MNLCCRFVLNKQTNLIIMKTKKFYYSFCLIAASYFLIQIILRYGH